MSPLGPNALAGITHIDGMLNISVDPRPVHRVHGMDCEFMLSLCPCVANITSCMKPMLDKDCFTMEDNCIFNCQDISQGPVWVKREEYCIFILLLF